MSMKSISKFPGAPEIPGTSRWLVLFHRFQPKNGNENINVYPLTMSTVPHAAAPAEIQKTKATDEAAF